MSDNMDIVLCKIIKAYLINNPYRTAREIFQFIISTKLGIEKEYTPWKIAHIIRKYNDNKATYWFNVESETIERKTVYYVKEE